MKQGIYNRIRAWGAGRKVCLVPSLSRVVFAIDLEQCKRKFPKRECILVSPFSAFVFILTNMYLSKPVIAKYGTWYRYFKVLRLTLADVKPATYRWLFWNFNWMPK